MIKIENIEVFGWESAIRGMRNPMNSWDKSDSLLNISCDDCTINKDDLLFKADKDACYYCKSFNGIGNIISPNDLKLMQSLISAGTDHSKFMRMINITMDITAPLYWWKEFDTYKVGTVANSCSTMHKIQAKEFTLDDFSHEHISLRQSVDVLKETIEALNVFRNVYLNGGILTYETGKQFIFQPKDKEIWWQMIQLLPSSYNQKRTVQLNYQVLRNIYFARRSHRLDEWHDFCRVIEELPYGKELICLEDK